MIFQIFSNLIKLQKKRKFFSNKTNTETLKLQFLDLLLVTLKNKINSYFNDFKHF